MITEKDIDIAAHQASEAKENLRDLKHRYALQECPLSIGDVVTIAGFSHAGKKMRVECISPPRIGFYGSWVASGSLFKVNGEVGKHIGEITQRDYEESQKENTK